MADLGITSSIPHTAPIDRIGQKQQQNKHEQDKKEKGKEPLQDKVEISGLVDPENQQSNQNKKEKSQEDKEANSPGGIGDLIDIKA